MYQVLSPKNIKAQNMKTNEEAATKFLKRFSEKLKGIMVPFILVKNDKENYTFHFEYADEGEQGYNCYNNQNEIQEFSDNFLKAIQGEIEYPHITLTGDIEVFSQIDNLIMDLFEEIQETETREKIYTSIYGSINPFNSILKNLTDSYSEDITIQEVLEFFFEKAKKEKIQNIDQLTLLLNALHGIRNKVDFSAYKNHFDNLLISFEPLIIEEDKKIEESEFDISKYSMRYKLLKFIQTNVDSNDWQYYRKYLPIMKNNQGNDLFEESNFKLHNFSISHDFLCKNYELLLGNDSIKSMLKIIIEVMNVNSSSLLNIEKIDTIYSPGSEEKTNVFFKIQSQSMGRENEIIERGKKVLVQLVDFYQDVIPLKLKENDEINYLKKLIPACILKVDLPHKYEQEKTQRKKKI